MITLPSLKPKPKSYPNLDSNQTYNQTTPPQNLNFTSTLTVTLTNDQLTTPLNLELNFTTILTLTLTNDQPNPPLSL